MTDLHTLAMAAAELVDDIGDQAERDRRSRAAGYQEGAALARAMFDHGVDVGRALAERAEAERWAAVAADVRAMAGEPAAREMARRRAVPAGEAYFRDLIRHGGTEFAGVGRPRVPAPAGAYEAALAWARDRKGRAA